jgi:HK97 family phage major capsid protein
VPKREQELNALRTATAGELRRLSLSQIDAHLQNVDLLVAEADDVRHSVMTAAAGRPLTASQQRDYSEAAEVRVEYKALADRLGSVRRERKLANQRAAELEVRGNTDAIDGPDAIDPSEPIDGGGLQRSGDFDPGPNWDGDIPGQQRGYDRQGRITRQEFTYRQDRGGWLKDLKALTESGSSEARARLARNSKEWDAENRSLTTYTSGAASDLAPPAWALDRLATVARAGRVTADQLSGNPLPDNAMTLNFPRIVSGSSVAAQATENTTVSDTNIGTDMVSSSVHTLAGKQVMSYQLVDQSPLNIDQLIVDDLGRELAKQVDLFALNSNASGKYGLLHVPSGISASYTDPTPSVAGLYSALAGTVAQISTTRFEPPNKIIMHPRRWSWLLAASDSTGRPLVLPAANSPMNSAAVQRGVIAQGAAGEMLGLPVFLDANISTTNGGGNNEDVVLMLNTNDLLLYESQLRLLPDRISLAGQLSLQLVLWEYVLIQFQRYPSSVAVVSGTGLAAPVFS